MFVTEDDKIHMMGREKKADDDDDDVVDDRPSGNLHEVKKPSDCK